jgi:hypothetical protein
MPRIRKPVVAGSFYPSAPEALSRQIKQFLEKVPPVRIPGEIKVIIAPHAGYIFSGQVAAHAYKTVQGKKFDLVVVLALSHRLSFAGAAVYDGDFFQTPLGDVPVDGTKIKALISSSKYFAVNEKADALPEHSLEVQIPFLQVALGNFKLVPLTVSQYNLEVAAEMAEALYKTVGPENVLVVASTDFSHFYPAAVAEKMDQAALDLIAAGNYKELFNSNAELCGLGPVVVAMMYAEKAGARNIKVLSYAHSGQVTGDNSEVVGYGAVAFSR